MRNPIQFMALIALVVFAPSCGDDDPTTPTADDPTAYLAGGETTIFNATTQAYTFPATNLVDLDLHLDGDLAFESAFVGAGAPVQGGLGPIFNNNSCTACHVGNGRGRPFLGTDTSSLLIRISVPGDDGHGGPAPVPGFGLQLNNKSLFGVAPEATVVTTYAPESKTFANGDPYTLHHPQYELADPYIELPADVMMSPRIALPVFGRGLLEAIDASTLLGYVDEADSDNDGISGRANYVWDVQSESMELGRFGWKANQPNLIQQAAAAYRNDMGITSPLFPTDSASGQSQGDGLGDDPEIPLATVEEAAFYTQTLAVPARRNPNDELVKRGEGIFSAANCNACHVPSMTTGTHPDIPEVSHQNIQAFTDLLLHDMGAGLADGRSDFLATGSEWRTTPLWGLGLTATVQGATHLLHDGRAQSILEAVMWHGGEAEASRDYVHDLSPEDRDALLTYLRSL